MLVRGRRITCAKSCTYPTEGRTETLEERLAWGEAYQLTGLAFTRADGALIHPDRFLDAFKRHPKAAGLKPCHIHDLRHAHASVLLEAGVPMKAVSDRLGHSTLAITADLYTHVSPLDRQAAEARAALILGA